MNKTLLKKIAAHIITNPEKFYVHDWFGKREECGTTACIAGRAALLLGGKANYKAASTCCFDSFEHAGQPANKNPRWMKRVIKALDITNDQAFKLFFVENWPEEYRITYYEEQDNAAYKTYRRIHSFICTGE